MTAFLLVSALIIAIMVGGWLRLAPSVEDKRLMALRLAAVRQGLVVRLMSQSERDELGLDGPQAWYCLVAGGTREAGADALAVVAGAGCRWLRGAPRTIPAGCIPPGVSAVGLGSAGLRVAWDEKDEAALGSVVAWLRAWEKESGI